ncbi:MAG: alpha/beta fold hydrolase [Leptospiraceae bacterium]|nr:alpha/beta fold hydrolase [Leptospiraceae bacterium]
MKLFFRKVGEKGKPIVILHGLFGSSKNWISNAKILSETRTVYSLDLRNHGDSPHSDSHTLEDLVNDLKEFIEENLDEKPDLIGHSMGGMTTTLLALHYPELFDKFVCVDIAPRTYPLRFEEQFKALSMDVSEMKSREEIDKKMSEILPDPFLRNFLQMNLERNETGYRWKINTDVLHKSRKSLEFPGNLPPYTGICLFVLGEISEYIHKEDSEVIKSKFPGAELKWISGAGHYLHYTHSKEFLKIVSDFLNLS